MAWNSRAELERNGLAAQAARALPAAAEAATLSPEQREPASDASLVERVRGGDGSAFEQLVDRHGGRLYGAAYALVGNAADAEDIVQETFAGAFRAARDFRGESSVQTWLLKILMRQAARARRTRRKWRFLSLAGGGDSGANAPAVDPAPAASAAGPAAGVDSRLDVAAMLRRLTPEHREVIVLRELQGLSYEEMAAALSVPRGTVESRLHRARQELRQKFEGYFGS